MKFLALSGQAELEPGTVLLALMLSSDQMVVWGNNRHKAWPLYLKLGKYVPATFTMLYRIHHRFIGNIPMQLRNKFSTYASRVLAYLPTIQSNDYKNAEWFRAAKRAIFHHVLRIIFRPFRTAPPYQRFVEMLTSFLLLPYTDVLPFS